MAADTTFDTVVGWAGIIGTVLAALALVVALAVTTSLFQWSALLLRRLRTMRRAIGTVRDERIALGPFLRETRALLRRRVGTGGATVREELEWVGRLVGATAAEPGPTGATTVAVPFTFAAGLAGTRYPAGLSELAAAYERYGVAVRRRWVLRSSAGPLVAEEHEIARRTASLLRRWAGYLPVPEPSDPNTPDPRDPDRLRHRSVDLSHVTDTTGQPVPTRVQLVTWPFVTARSALGFPTVAVSYQPLRVVVDGTPSQRSAPRDGVVTEVIPAGPDPRPVDPLGFDGVLTRWHGTGCRLEVDQASGRQQLHLCVSETSYFAVRATQPNGTSAPHTGRARLLTMVLLCVDDDRVLLVRRSEYVVYPGRFTGTLSGNCELAPREGHPADRDENGLPDLLGAVAREAREELGLDLTEPGSAPGVLGVVEVDTESETGSHVLVATARLPGPAPTFTFDLTQADPVEGLWELGEDALVVDIAAATATADDARSLVDWLRSSPELTATACGALLLLVISRQQLAQEQHDKARGAVRPPLPWTTADLAAWLDAPAPTWTAGPDPAFVGRRPLCRRPCDTGPVTPSGR
ncbi:MAG: NUDIX domain-containing protein [Actinobacteria bacterium]|nr:NUDIX domain-containing protein [Actinomycetota bacterium]